MLKQDYKEGEMTLKTALALAIKVLNKTMDVSKLSAEKGEQSLAQNGTLCSNKGSSECTHSRRGSLQCWLSQKMVLEEAAALSLSLRGIQIA